ncbi:hypothetical protein [Georgenia faecalis]|uniref:Uncharacterized protein n=1 Tax=Georgenia faecalis TaxID=2483799 RepID=A0ABV9DBE8_9MICO|nr:hypothetical protein [Georgenia faecalis]
MSVNPPTDPDEPQDGTRPGDEEPTRPLDGGEEPTRPLDETADPTRPLDEGAGPTPYDADAPTQPFGAAPAPATQDGASTDPYATDADAGARTGASTYSRPSYADGAEGGGPDGTSRSKGPVILMIVGAVILIAAAVIAAIAFFGRNDEDPAPGATATTETTTEASASPSAEPTTEETATSEPSATASGDLLRQLDTSVTAGDATFTLTEAGFVPEAGIVESGAVEAYLGTYSDGTNEIQLLATAWPSVEEADAYAAAIIGNLGGAEEVATGETYTNGMGTYWAYLLEDGSGMYLWTTDRGEVLRATGSPDWVGQFYSNYSI